MKTKSFPTNRNRAKKLKSDTNSEFTPVQTMHINQKLKDSILSPSESSLIPSPIADVQPNPQLDFVSLKESQQLAPVSVGEAIAKMLEYMGVQYAFGVSGGAIAPLWHALQHSDLRVLHFRHEAGAAFAARCRGVLCEWSSRRGVYHNRFGDHQRANNADVFTLGSLFNYATTLECSEQLR